MKHQRTEHEEAQEAAAARYARATGLWLERAPGGTFSPVDYVARESARYGQPVVEVLEFKCRGCGVGAFHDVWLEARKVEKLGVWGEHYAAPAYFVVEWADGEMRRITANDIARLAGDPVVKTRRDARDEYDTDLMYILPIAAMEVVCGAPVPAH